MTVLEPRLGPMQVAPASGLPAVKLSCLWGGGGLDTRTRKVGRDHVSTLRGAEVEEVRDGGERKWSSGPGESGESWEGYRRVPRGLPAGLG